MRSSALCYRTLVILLACALFAGGAPVAEARVGDDAQAGNSRTATAVKPSPVLTISQDPSPAYVGDAVKFTVTADPVPDGGTVYLFFGDSEDRITQLLGSQPVGGEYGGTATFSATFAAQQGLQMKATYSGTETYDPSESATFVRSEIAPPLIWWISKPYSWWYSETAEFAFKSLESTYWQPAVSFECQVDGGSWTTCSSPHVVGPLPDGPHIFRVRGLDANGRISEHPAEWGWRIDTQPPILHSVVANGGKPYLASDVVRIDLTAEDQWYVHSAIGYGQYVLDENGVLANPQGPDQFTETYYWDFTESRLGGSTENGPKTIYFQVSDPFGRWSTVESASFIYDTQPPAVSPPSVSIATGKTAGSFIPVTVKWEAASDAWSGVSGYQLMSSMNGGSWTFVDLTSELTLAASVELRKGYTYAFRVRARDGAGNWSPWAEGVTLKAALRQERNAAIAYTGEWPLTSVSGSWGGYVKRGKAAGATASTSFTGRSIGWVSTKGPKRGQARIYVDGVLEAAIDLYAASKTARRIVWQRSWSSTRTHTVQIRVVGTTNRPGIDVDAFVLLASP